MSGRVIMAVSHYGDKLRDTEIAVTLWDSTEAALAELREAFADDLAEDRERDLLMADENPDTEDGLLDVLRWHHNVIVTIVPVELCGDHHVF